MPQMSGGPPLRNDPLIKTLRDLLSMAERGQLLDAIMVSIGPGGVAAHGCHVMTQSEMPRMIGEMSAMLCSMENILIAQRAAAAQQQQRSNIVRAPEMPGLRG